MINSRIVNISLLIAGFLSLSLVVFPELDLSFSQIFFTKEDGFIYKRNFIVYQIYNLLPWFTRVFTGGCLLLLVYIWGRERNNSHPERTEGSQENRLKTYGILHCVRDDESGLRDDNNGIRNDVLNIIRSGVFFLFISAIIGPGLVVNTIFKENFGRARPAQIEFFNGAKEFSPAFKITNQCETNCSFSSGHAAMGFFFTAFAYVWRGRGRHPVRGDDKERRDFNKIYLAGLIFGSLVGISRIMMGGHFLSDVVVSAFVVLFLNHIIFILWQKVVVSLKK